MMSLSTDDLRATLQAIQTLFQAVALRRQRREEAGDAAIDPELDSLIELFGRLLGVVEMQAQVIQDHHEALERLGGASAAVVGVVAPMVGKTPADFLAIADAARGEREAP